MLPGGARRRTVSGSAIAQARGRLGPEPLAALCADIMMGFTLLAGRLLGVLDHRYPTLLRYLDRLEERLAYRAAVEM